MTAGVRYTGVSSDTSACSSCNRESDFQHTYQEEFMMVTRQVLQYYRQHSILTDPGAYAALYEDLPRDVPGLIRVVQEVLIYVVSPC